MVPYGPNVTRPRKQDLDLEALLGLLRNSGHHAWGRCSVLSLILGVSSSPCNCLVCSGLSSRFFGPRPFRLPALASSSSGRLAAFVFCRHIAPVSKNLLSSSSSSQNTLCFFALLRLKERERTICSMLFVITIVRTLHFATTN